MEVDSKDSRGGDKEGDAIGKVGAEPLMGSEVGLGRRGDLSGLGARFRILFDWRLGAASLDRWWWKALTVGKQVVDSDKGGANRTSKRT